MNDGIPLPADVAEYCTAHTQGLSVEDANFEDFSSDTRLCYVAAVSGTVTGRLINDLSRRFGVQVLTRTPRLGDGIELVVTRSWTPQRHWAWWQAILWWALLIAIVLILWDGCTQCRNAPGYTGVSLKSLHVLARNAARAFGQSRVQEPPSATKSEL